MLSRSACVFAAVTAATVATVTLSAGQRPAAEPESTPLDTACLASAIQAQAAADISITAARVVAAAGRAPAHCQVDGEVAVPGNAVSFRLGLPERWNGKLLFIGVGGLGGQFGSLTQGLERGYATATTDTGHRADDPNWGSSRAKEVDYGHRGTHVSAVAGKAITQAFYARPLRKAYFNGCSNGGRQALMEVQRYPADFDGVIAGDPATGTPMQVGRAIVYQKMLASPEAYVPSQMVERLSAATLAACDATDGLTDGLVSDPTRCGFKAASLRCRDGQATDCLSTKQLEVVEQIYGGVRLATGETYAHGFPPGHEGGATGWTAWMNGTVPPSPQGDGTLTFGERPPTGFQLSGSNFRFLMTDDDDPALTWRSLDLARDLPRLKIMTDILSPREPDLRPFKARGGKLILYHGWADPAISALGTIDYWQKVGAAVGGDAERSAFVRLFLMPGMHHCSGGPGPNEFDMLTALERWAEEDLAPASVLATHRTDGRVDRTRPLCAHPQVATYSGTGSIDEAANFRCAFPAALPGAPPGR